MKYFLPLKLAWISGYLILLFTSCVSANASLVDKAYEHYALKEYKEALNIWYGMAAGENLNAALYYNIGLAESMLGNTPQAIFAFEQARRINPVNKEFKTALLEERRKIENATIPVSPFFLQEWYHGCITILRPGMWALLGILALLVVVLNWLAGLNHFKFKPFISNRYVWFLGIASILFVFCALLAYQQLYREDEVIIEQQCEFRQAPADESPSSRTLFPGEKARIKDQVGNWYQVQLLNLDTGWIQKNCSRQILLRKT